MKMERTGKVSFVCTGPTGEKEPYLEANHLFQAELLVNVSTEIFRNFWK